eukprot:PhF_6_TR16776/c0_g1_i1/m.25368/K05759/PFN; profilin
MSWQEYVDNNLIGSGFMHTAMIVGLDGSFWAWNGPEIPSDTAEVTHILACIDNPSVAQSSGVTIFGKKYFVIRAEAGLIYGKLGAAGICMKKSGTAIVIGIYGEGTPAPKCNMAVEGIANYLVTVGY